MNRAWIAVAIVAVLTRLATAQSLEGWRTPSGELYFGSAPPPGSTRIEGVRPRRTAQPSAPPATPRATATPRPTATSRPTAPPTSTPTARPPATPRPVAPPTEPVCGDVVAIRDSRPTIDFEANRVVISGEVVVISGAQVKDLRVCLSGSCTPVARGKVLAEGDTARFTVSAPSSRPTGFTVECSVIR